MRLFRTVSVMGNDATRRRVAKAAAMKIAAARRAIRRPVTLPLIRETLRLRCP